MKPHWLYDHWRTLQIGGFFCNFLKGNFISREFCWAKFFMWFKSLMLDYGMWVKLWKNIIFFIIWILANSRLMLEFDPLVILWLFKFELLFIGWMIALNAIVYRFLNILTFNVNYWIYNDRCWTFLVNILTYKV